MYVSAFGIVGNASYGNDDGQDEEEEDVEICGQRSARVRIGGRATIEAAARSWTFTVGRGPVAVAVAMSKAVAHPVPVAVVRTGEGADLQVCHRHALLVDTKAIVATTSSFRGKARVHIINPQVNQSCTARDDLTPTVDK